MKSNPRIAFVIDALPAIGGGEKVLFTALEIFPTADVFTLIYNQDVFVGTPIANKKVKTSFINTLPFARQYHRLFLPLMPKSIERFDLQKYDLIVSFSYAVAHGVQNFNGARHVSYMYTPMRYAWTDLNLDGTHTRKNLILDELMRAFRNWDKKAASRVHQFATISQTVSKRIADAYHREAPIIYPPVDVERFHPSRQRENFYITISRLVPHKRVDLIVRAFSLLNLPLIVIGVGPELPKLRFMAGPNIQFCGFESDKNIVELLGKARAFVSIAEEDFGIAIVEAQASGCPVITYKGGGALETVISGVTGQFFNEQSSESLIEAIQEFEKQYSCFHVDDLVQNARKYDKARFVSEFQSFVESKT
jgi:glycosyltransferase involved in cell wall biosynthesis